MDEKLLEYIVEFNGANKEALSKTLAPYEVQYAKLIPVAFVRVPRQAEASLLEELATIPEITYRRALERNALSGERDE